jgi:hypothetical protein
MNEFGKFLAICMVISWLSVILHGFHKWYQFGGPFKYHEHLEKRRIEIDSMKTQLDSITIKIK